MILFRRKIDILFIYRVSRFSFKKNIIPLIFCKVNSGVQNTWKIQKKRASSQRHNNPSIIKKLWKKIFDFQVIFVSTMWMHFKTQHLLRRISNWRLLAILFDAPVYKIITKRERLYIKKFFSFHIPKLLSSKIWYFLRHENLIGWSMEDSLNFYK